MSNVNNNKMLKEMSQTLCKIISKGPCSSSGLFRSIATKFIPLFLHHTYFYASLLCIKSVKIVANKFISSFIQIYCQPKIYFMVIIHRQDINDQNLFYLKLILIIQARLNLIMSHTLT